MRIALISVVALLGFLFPQMLLADGEAAEFTMMPRAQKIFEQAPKTPEELLTVIKEFMDNPNMNGYEFVENISGIDRAHWGLEHNGETAKGDKFKSFAILCPKCPYRQRGLKIRALPTAYVVGGSKIDPENDLLIEVGASFRRGKLLNNISFVVTPATINDFFGKPAKVYVTSARSEYSPGFYDLRYTYNIGGRYEFGISFRAKQDDDPELQKQRWKHTAEQARKEIKQRKDFENHKNFIALGLSLYRQLRLI
jgi:hypothetical protein